jgi:HPt (histidine-containing phosphotransfer) domain-containing protein
LGLITEFEETMRADIAAISAALDTQDISETAKIAHRSQGLCLVIGAKRLAGLLKRIEVEAADPASQAAIASLVSQLDVSLSFTIAELRAISQPTASQPKAVN